MSHRTRTIKWCEQKIISELSKRKAITTCLALSALVFTKEMRNLQEQHHFDIALVNLLSKREIKKDIDGDGFAVFKLAK